MEVHTSTMTQAARFVSRSPSAVDVPDSKKSRRNVALFSSKSADHVHRVRNV